MSSEQFHVNFKLLSVCTSIQKYRSFKKQFGSSGS